MGERAQAEVAERVGHTPGPWEAGLSSGRRVLCVTADEGRTWICGELLNDFEPMAGTEAKANARLIAAAPDMLAALTEMLADEAEWFEDHPDDHDKRAGDSLGKSIYRARWLKRERARAAIAKAEGR